MAKRRRYQATTVAKIGVDDIGRSWREVTVGIDVAKKTQFALFAGGHEQLDEAVLVRWDHPEQTRAFFDLCLAIRARGQKVTVVMEPTGTYGDPFLSWFWEQRIEVRRVLGKQVADGAAAFDGISSSHDPKATVMLVKLHLIGGSQPWLQPPEATRQLRALEAELAWYDDGAKRLMGKMEGLVARHWPELASIIKPAVKLLWSLFAEFGGPRRIAEEPARVHRFIVRNAPALKPGRAEAIVASAQTTVGVRMTPDEENWACVMADEYLERQAKRRRLASRIKTALAGHASDELVALMGARTTATLLAFNLDPLKFRSAKAFIKALGLSLREHSSGTHKGRLRITKRGAPRVRWLVVLSALRLIARDRIVRAWHGKKRARDGARGHAKNGMISAVAVARKLAAAAWHVARGDAFDAAKLFDTSRLPLQASSQEVVPRVADELATDQGATMN